jgi:sugar/nucleoside kinase (ribokinase family)
MPTENTVGRLFKDLDVAAAIILGNVTLDIICQTVDDVPRYESVSFDHVIVSPGGCGSNTAIGLAAAGIKTALIACVGQDDAAWLLMRTWEQFGIDTSYIQKVVGKPTGTSVGLVDSEMQPRFIHTSGANARLTSDKLPIEALLLQGGRSLHIAGFFVLPGLLDGQLPDTLRQSKCMGLETSLDVVRSPRLRKPEGLWPCLPYLDIFLCNMEEGRQLTGLIDEREIASALSCYGVGAVVVKCGAAGCWLASKEYTGMISGFPVTVVDTTGAGDAFAAGLVAARINGANLFEACREGNKAGAKACCTLGAVSHYQIQSS